MDAPRAVVARLFEVTDVGAAENEDRASPIRSSPLAAWARRAGDPGPGAAGRSTVRGATSQRRHQVAVMILLFRVLGFPLSFRKGSLGARVDWIGFAVHVEPKASHATIAKQRVDELRGLVEEALMVNVVSRKWLKSFAGKASSFASVLVFWRPFLQCLWSAIYAAPSAGVPKHCVWVK